MQKHLDKQFKTAAQMDAPRRIKDIVRRQPGYSRQHGPYRLARAKSGGIRLYALVGDQWMDASLNDIKD